MENQTNILNGWAGFVHSRTLNVDYRPKLLAGPENVSPAELDSLRNLSLAATRCYNDRNGVPIFVALRSGELTVAGIAIESTQLKNYQAYQRDKYGRAFNVFLGYVTRSPVECLPERSILTFESLYEFVATKWNAIDYEARERVFTNFSTKLNKTNNIDCSDIDLNLDNTCQSLFPLSHAEKLWSAFGFVRSDSSLILGPESRKVENLFYNAACRDCKAVVKRSLNSGTSSDEINVEPSKTQTEPVEGSRNHLTPPTQKGRSRPEISTATEGKSQKSNRFPSKLLIGAVRLLLTKVFPGRDNKSKKEP